MGIFRSAKAPAEPASKRGTRIADASFSGADADRDQRAPSPGFTRPAATIRICDMQGNTVQIIEVPAIEAERIEFDEAFADDDESPRRAGPDADRK